MNQIVQTAEKAEPGHAVAVFRDARLPYHPAIEQRFGIDKSGWKALTDAIFPLATSTDSIVLALSYCRARNLDPFKRAVHIVPMWSKEQGRMVDTVWPGIGELRTTAFRTGLYAGRDDAEFGPDITSKLGGAEMTFPEWCRVTVYRMCGGERRAFAGPKVYWMETYATAKRDSMAPNSMWQRRPRGQIEKCAEAAALRSAFPEEIGDTYASDEMEGQGMAADRTISPDAPPRPALQSYVAIDAKPAEEAKSEAPTARGRQGKNGDQAPEPVTICLTDADGLVVDYTLPGDAQAFETDLVAQLGMAAAASPEALAGIAESNGAALDQFRAAGFGEAADRILAKCGEHGLKPAQGSLY